MIITEEKKKHAKAIQKKIRSEIKLNYTISETAALILLENQGFMEIYKKEKLEKNFNQKPKFEQKNNYKIPEKKALAEYISFWTNYMNKNLGGKNLAIIAEYLYQKSEK